MKSTWIAFVFLVPFFAHSQKGTATFSASYGTGRGQVKTLLAKAEMLGTYAKGNIRTLDINLAGAVNKSTAIEIGVSVLNHQYQFTAFDFYTKSTTENRSINTMVFPIKLKVDILKYLFISGGFLLTADIGRSYQADLGVSIGGGIQYYFKNKYGVFIYPQTNVHRLTIGLAESHIAFGLAYRIPQN